jgi:hypothetical protein
MTERTTPMALAPRLHEAGAVMSLVGFAHNFADVNGTRIDISGF